MIEEGIIQKVFSRYIQLHDCECPDKETNRWNELIIRNFKMIEQELIEEIEKEASFCMLRKAITLSKLIGETKE